MDKMGEEGGGRLRQLGMSVSVSGEASEGDEEAIGRWLEW